MSIQLKKFDMSSIKPDKVVVLIGKRETGKSFLCKDLLYYHRNIPVGTVISGTESANCFYGNIIPSIFIHDEYTPEIIKNLLKRQKTVKKQILGGKLKNMFLGGKQLSPYILKALMATWSIS